MTEKNVFLCLLCGVGLAMLVLMFVTAVVGVVTDGFCFLMFSVTRCVLLLMTYLLWMYFVVLLCGNVCCELSAALDADWGVAVSRTAKRRGGEAEANARAQRR